MVATPKILGGHTEMTMTLNNGILGTTSTVGDTTAVPKALIAAVQTALPALLHAAAAGNATAGFPAPYLYKLVVRDGVLHFVGHQGMLHGQSSDTPINIQAPIVTGQSQ